MKILRIAIVLGAISYLFGFPGLSSPQPAPKVTLDGYGTSSDSCAGKKRCVAVYVAPWCPSCHRAIGFIDEVFRYWNGTEVGVKVIVGQDDNGKLRQMANEFEAPTYLDQTGDFYESYGLRGVPSWIVLDDKNQILTKIASGGASGGDSPTDAVEYFIKKKLDLEEFLVR